ncbi:hypothetical protein N1851_029233 [Merluccius polli]|uniref:Uncharacterized protein n=1 Tax=Merluccius polli TaxID=89951 RepID=A0AA47M780_MERPO|nr:hypothetical protein N1851_029233 [Merluccius polli]
MRLRRHRDGCGSRGVTRGPHKLPRHKPGTDHPWLGRLGQCVDLILGSNLLRYLIRQLKTTRDFKKGVFTSEQDCAKGNRLISVVANVERWREGDVPDKVWTLRLRRAVTLEPMQEHWVG